MTVISQISAGFPANAQKLPVAQHHILRDSAANRELRHGVGRRHDDRPVTVPQLGPGDAKPPARQVRAAHDTLTIRPDWQTAACPHFSKQAR
jgi:hypothetical protein